MEMKIGKFIITKVPDSNLFDLQKEITTKTGKTAGTTYREPVGYGMRIDRILELMVVQEVDLTKSNEDLGGLLKELKQTTIKIGEELKNLLKTH